MAKGISKPVGAHELEPVSLSELIHQHVRAAIEVAVHEELRADQVAPNRRLAEDRRGAQPAHRSGGLMIRRAALAVALALGLLAAPYGVRGQTPGNVHRVGIIHVSGHHHVVVDGLRQGLQELGLEEGKHFTLDIRKTTGDPKSAEEAARDLERGTVDLIYTVTSQVTVAARRATARTPIVFYVGADPVALGLVESFAKPGGRLTGVHGLSRDVTAKRLAVLKEMIPRLRRVITFYNPGEPVSRENARVGRDAARQSGVQVVERHVGSIEELRLNLQGFKSREVDATSTRRARWKQARRR